MSPWKQCDIRGRFPDEVSPALYGQIGCAAAAMLPERSRVLVAGDFRHSTPELKASLIDALSKGGMHVLDAGQIPTPMAYFAHRTMRSDAVFIVTASHNPPGYNGLKLMLGCLPPNEALFAALREPAVIASGRPEGSVEAVDVATPYRAWIANRWRGLRPPSGFSIVIDAGNGAWSDFAPGVMAELGITAHPLFCAVDPDFPNRPADSAKSANLAALCREVRTTESQLGIAWDGDGDRVAFVDCDGRVATADQVSILFARYLLTGNPGAKAVCDLKLSDRVRESIEASDGQALIERSGHAFIKRRMIEEDCLFGCEASGHYFYRELRGGDDGLHSALLMIELIGAAGPLNELLDALPALFITPDLRLPLTATTFESVVKRLAAGLPVMKTSNLDGVRFFVAGGTVLVRQSITEPAITLRIESRNQQVLDRLIEDCTRLLPELEREIRTHAGLSRESERRPAL